MEFQRVFIRTLIERLGDDERSHVTAVNVPRMDRFEVS